MSYYFPALSHFENGNGWSGSTGAILRYEIETPENGMMTAVTWKGPFSRPFAQEYARAEFSLDAAGMEAVQNWLKATAETLKQD